MPSKWYKQWKEEVMAEAAMVWKGCLERPRALTMQQAGGQDCTAEGTTAYPKAWLGKRARIKEGVNGKPQTPVKRDYSHISLNF